METNLKKMSDLYSRGLLPSPGHIASASTMWALQAATTILDTETRLGLSADAKDIDFMGERFQLTPLQHAITTFMAKCCSSSCMRAMDSFECSQFKRFCSERLGKLPTISHAFYTKQWLLDMKETSK